MSTKGKRKRRTFSEEFKRDAVNLVERIIGDRPTFSLSVVHIQSQVQHPIKKAPLSFQFS